MPDHKPSAPFPTGVIAPIPVTATLRDIVFRPSFWRYRPIDGSVWLSARLCESFDRRQGLTSDVGNEVRADHPLSNQPTNDRPGQIQIVIDPHGPTASLPREGPGDIHPFRHATNVV